MIDAGVRVHVGVDIYGPCSGQAQSGLGGPSSSGRLGQNLRGSQDLQEEKKKHRSL